jgi:hypothetical protein
VSVAVVVVIVALAILCLCGVGCSSCSIVAPVFGSPNYSRCLFHLALTYVVNIVMLTLVQATLSLCLSSVMLENTCLSLGLRASIHVALPYLCLCLVEYVVVTGVVDVAVAGVVAGIVVVVVVVVVVVAVESVVVSVARIVEIAGNAHNPMGETLTN